MANTWQKVVVQEGVRNFTVNVNGTLDSSDQPLTTIILPSDCTYYIPKNFRLDEIRFSISDPLEVSIWWQGTPDTLIANLVGRSKVCYEGGLQNNAYRPTGCIDLSTSGYVSGIQVYNLMFDFVKINVDNRI